MVNRLVFTLATAMTLLFFLVCYYDSFFFLVHFLEAAIYVVIMLLLFYGVDDWAYLMGMVVPLFWTVLTLLSGTLIAGLRALVEAVRFEPVANPVGLLSGFIFLVGLGMMAASARAFWREVWGTRGALRRMLMAAGVVGVYYAILVAAVWRLASPAR